MHIESLKTFCDLAETESFTKAAQVNGVTQSAVSQTISAMERQFKSQLVERSKKLFRLTREGEVVYEYSRKIIGLYDSFNNKLQEIKDVVSGSIRVSTIYSIGLHSLPAVLKDFLPRYPDVSVHVEYRRADQVCARVLDNMADLGIVAYAEHDGRLETVPLREDPLAVICHPHHAFARLKSIKLKALQGQRLVSFERDIPTRKALDRLFRGQSIHVEHVMEFDNVETVKRAVEIDTGIAVVPLLTVTQEVAQGTLAAVKLDDDGAYRPMSAIYKKNKVLSPAMKLFIAALKQTA